MKTLMNDFLRLVSMERIRQNVKWGEQTHSGHTWVSVLAEEVGEAAQAINDNDIPQAMDELVQVAAVCCAMWEQAASGRGSIGPAWGKYKKEA